MAGNKLSIIPIVVGFVVGIVLYHGVRLSWAHTVPQNVITGEQNVVREKPVDARVAQVSEAQTPPTAGQIEAELNQHRAAIEAEVQRIRQEGQQMGPSMPGPEQRRPPAMNRFQMEAEVVAASSRHEASVYVFKMDTSTGQTWYAKTFENGDMGEWKLIGGR